MYRYVGAWYSQPAQLLTSLMPSSKYLTDRCVCFGAGAGWQGVRWACAHALLRVSPGWQKQLCYSTTHHHRYWFYFYCNTEVTSPEIHPKLQILNASPPSILNHKLYSKRFTSKRSILNPKLYDSRFLRIARRLRAQAKSALQLPSVAKTKRLGGNGLVGRLGLLVFSGFGFRALGFLGL